MPKMDEKNVSGVIRWMAFVSNATPCTGFSAVTGTHVLSFAGKKLHVGAGDVQREKFAQRHQKTMARLDCTRDMWLRCRVYLGV